MYEMRLYTQNNAKLFHSCSSLTCNIPNSNKSIFAVVTVLYGIIRSSYCSIRGKISILSYKKFQSNSSYNKLATYYAC